MHSVLFYKARAGRDVLLDWIRSLPEADRRIVGEDLRTVQKAFPVGLPVCNNLGGGLWEVRSSLSSKREARLIFFQSSSVKALVVVHGFIKKTRKTPAAELILARRRMNEFQPGHSKKDRP